MHITKLSPSTFKALVKVPHLSYALRVDMREHGGDVYERAYPDSTPVHAAIQDLVSIATGQGFIFYT